MQLRQLDEGRGHFCPPPLADQRRAHRRVARLRADIHSGAHGSLAAERQVELRDQLIQPLLRDRRQSAVLPLLESPGTAPPKPGLVFDPRWFPVEFLVPLEQLGALPVRAATSSWLRCSSWIMRSRACAISIGFKSSRWMFSTKVTSRTRSGSISRTIAEIVASPAIFAARQPRS